MELAELHVCAASDRHMYEPVVACQAAAAQQGLFDIANVLLIGALGIIDIVSSLMLSAVAEWSSWEVKRRDFRGRGRAQARVGRRRSCAHRRSLKHARLPVPP